MTEQPTSLDIAHKAMTAAPDDLQARARYYEVMADTELVVLLKSEPQADHIDPETFDVEDQSFVIAFDSEDRLAQFAGAAAPYAAISGRVLASMLVPAGIGLAINIEVAPSAFLAPPEGLDWLVETLGETPQEAEARILAINAPGRLPKSVLDALADRLTRAAGLAEAAFLVEAEYDTGARMPLLAILGAQGATQAPLAKTISEALSFSGIEAGALDVSFISEDDPRLPAFKDMGMRLDIPPAPEPPKVTHVAPGSDPDTPPKLR